VNFVRTILLSAVLSGTTPSVQLQLWSAGRIEVQTNFASPSVGVTLNVTL